MVADVEREKLVVRPSGAYSLLLLFYLTTMAAILLAAARLTIDNTAFTLRSFGLGALICSILGSILGSLTGFFVCRSALGVSIGAMVGVGVGIAAAWISLVAASNYTQMTVLVFAASWLVIVIAVVANRFSQ